MLFWIFREFSQKDALSLEIIAFFVFLNDFHAISSLPPTVNKGWRPGPLQKGATSKDLSVMRINKGAPMFQVCHGGGLPLLTRGGRYVHR